MGRRAGYWRDYYRNVVKPKLAARPRARRDSVVISVRVPRAVKDEWQRRANGQNLSAFIRETVELYLEQEDEMEFAS